MTTRAMRMLELDDALASIAARASSPVGRERVRRLTPLGETEGLAGELATVQEVAAFLAERPQWAPPEIPDAREALQRLVPEGSALDGLQLHRIGTLLQAGRLLREALADERESFQLLWRVAGDLHQDRTREDAIARTVDAAGRILDTASKELRRIRSDLSRAHGQLVRKLEQYLPTLNDRHRVSDASVTIRNGRYVVPVRREGRREVGGIVHDESATGATLFIEPPMAVQWMNDLKELERDEAREVQRILREHTAALRTQLHEMEASQEALAEFDSLYARARVALEWGATPPELLDPGTQALRIVDGRHPLLVLGSESGKVVPFQLDLDEGERAMVISGPNTGGKTVLLKAVGLISSLAQRGIIPPVGPGTRLPIFEHVFADIGDEQSIAASLSTFSAHLANVHEIVREAGSTSLVLIDEMGTGTDPAEGAALAQAVLEALVARRALVIVTSHLGALKRLDTEGSGIVNASLEFDSDRLEPTYVLVKGRPGRSYGLSIARGLGFPGDLLDRAETHLSDGDARLDELLEKLERKEREARQLAESLGIARRETTRLEAELVERERELSRREESADRRAREEARRMLLEARTEVETAIREVREAGSNELAQIEQNARRRVELAADRHRAASGQPLSGAGPPARDLLVGDRVRIRESGTPAEVLEIRDDRVVVTASGVRLTLPTSDLSLATRSAGEPKPTARGSGTWEAPEIEGPSELDLRGLRVDEVTLELERALDGAVLQDLAELRVIHGKGTGALRQRVQELLRSEKRVSSFRLGGPGEGGAGVTVVMLR